MFSPDQEILNACKKQIICYDCPKKSHCEIRDSFIATSYNEIFMMLDILCLQVFLEHFVNPAYLEFIKHALLIKYLSAHFPEQMLMSIRKCTKF